MAPLKSSKPFSQSKQKGRILRPFLWILITLIPILGYGKESSQLSFEFDSVNYSEATSLHSIAGEWSDSITPGDEALSVSRLYLGYQQGPFSFQYVERIDIYYNYANETVRFISLVENQQPLQVNDQYQLYIETDKLASRGFRFGYNTWLRDDIEIKAFFSLLTPTDIEKGSLNGSAMVVGTSDFDFDFHSDLVYKDDPLYGRATQELSGQGYSIDLAFHYIVSEKWDINLEFFDLVGEIKFDDVAFTTADATSNIKTFDENGYVIYNPVITGLEGNKSFTYKFNTQSHLAVAYNLANNNSIVLQHHQYKNTSFQELNYVQRFDPNQLAWNFIPKINAFGFTFKTPNFSFGLTTDNLDYKKTKFLSLSTQLYWVFD